MTKIQYDKKVKNFSNQVSIREQKLMSTLLNTSSFDFRLATSTPDIKSLTYLWNQLRKDYLSVIKAGNDVELIHYEIRCTDIARKTVEIVNNFLRFDLVLLVDEDSNEPLAEVHNGFG